MRKTVSSWTFVVRDSIRQKLRRRRVREVKAMLLKSAKVGIEVELNLPDGTSSGCRGNNPSCGCISIFARENGKACYATCEKEGHCDIEKEFGCAGMECVSFETACTSCDKFIVGCATCPERETRDGRPDAVRKRISEALTPTNFLGSLGAHGVLDVVVDGSLQNSGVEVVTVGRKIDFSAIQRMCSHITEVCGKEGAFADERCSIHYHLLVGYLTSGNTYNPKRKDYGLPHTKSPVSLSDLDSPLPEIVLANFHQLWRRYENAIIWLTSSGKEKNKLTRWVKFRQPLKKYSAIRHTMPRVIQQIQGAGKQSGRYMMVNYNPTQFSSPTRDKVGTDITRLHFEIRCPDGNLSATAISAFAVLFHGMLVKAAELSEFGTLESGDKAYMEQAHHIEHLLLNNDGDYNGKRHSNTEELGMYIPVLQEQAGELVKLLHGYLSNHPGTYEVLQALAQKPCSIRRTEGDPWDKIEHDLAIQHEDESKKGLLTLLDTTAITECITLQEWVNEASLETKIPVDTINKQVNQMVSSGEAYWTDALGTLVRR